MGGSRIEWIKREINIGDCLKIFSESNEYVFYCQNKSKQKITLSSKSPSNTSNQLVQYVDLLINKKKLFQEDVKEYKIISNIDKKLNRSKQLDISNLEKLVSGNLVEIVTEQNSYVFHYWYNDAQTLPLFSGNLILENIKKNKDIFIFSSLRPRRQDYLARGNFLTQYVGVSPEEGLLFQERIKEIYQI